MTMPIRRTLDCKQQHTWASQVTQWFKKEKGKKKKSTCQCRRLRRCRFDPWVGKIPWRRAWQPTPVFLSVKSHGQRSLVGYSPKGRKESDTTEATEAACKNVFEFHSLQFQLTSSWAVTCEDEKCLIRNLPYYVPSLQKCKLLRLQKDLNIMCYLKKKGMNQVSVSEGQLRQKHRCTIHIRSEEHTSELQSQL